MNVSCRYGRHRLLCYSLPFIPRGLMPDFVPVFPVYRGEFCHTDTFRANCSNDEVIIMTTATYGRMRLGRCVEIALGHVGCSADVLAMADRRCSGKRTCSIRVPDAEFESTRPCLKELKTYLEASFQCVPGNFIKRITALSPLPSSIIHPSIHPPIHRYPLQLAMSS